jgi:hypothetical protein
MTCDPTVFEVVLRAEPHPIDPIVRMRMLLRYALRAHALRCVIINRLSGKDSAVRISKAFPSKYLRAADVKELGGEANYTVRSVDLEEIGRDRTQKPVVRFREVKQGLVLNKTNSARLAASLGDDTDDWCGKRITLGTERVPLGGEIVDAIRCSVAGRFMEERRPPTHTEAAMAAQRPLDDILDDDISDL